jgi:hypothetical protein
MKRLHFLALALCLLGLGVSPAAAQKRTTHKTTTNKTASQTATLPPLEVRAARDHVDTQLTDVNAWLNKFGPIALNLDAAIADQKAGKLSSATAAKIDTAKQNVVTSIRDLKTGLTNLESEFRTKSSLAKYLPSIQGITDLAAKAEDSAITGQFVAAKDPLRDVTQKLTDTLNAMPKAGI